MTTRPRDSTPSLNEPPLIPMVKKLSVRLRRLWRMIHCFKRVRTGSLWCKSGWPLSGSKSRMYLIWLATWSGQRRTCDSSALRWYLASVTGLGGSFQFPFFVSLFSISDFCCKILVCWCKKTVYCLSLQSSADRSADFLLVSLVFLELFSFYQLVRDSSRHGSFLFQLFMTNELVVDVAKFI